MDLLEGVGDVLQEDQPQDNVLVLGGVQIVAELVGGGSKGGLKPQVCAGVGARFLLGTASGHGVGSFVRQRWDRRG